MGQALISVSARLVAQRRETPRQRNKRVVEGFIVSYPEIGLPLVIYERGRDNRITTSPVRRVLDEDGELWVETRNSVYRLILAH